VYLTYEKQFISVPEKLIVPNVAVLLIFSQIFLECSNTFSDFHTIDDKNEGHQDELVEVRQRSADHIEVRLSKRNLPDLGKGNSEKVKQHVTEAIFQFKIVVELFDGNSLKGRSDEHTPVIPSHSNVQHLDHS
jgi:hypothetical protein